MAEEKDKNDPNDVGTTGHVYDGDIEEYNNPLPRWWLWCFYLTIIWGVGYTIAYPAWPMVSGATAGVLGWSTRANVAADIEEHQAKNANLVTELVAADLGTLEPGTDLHRYAVSRGNAVFKAQCSQCHGSGAAGVKAAGYPNLLDDDWLWGGELEEIAYTVRHGIRNETDDDARYSEMPAFGDLLEAAEIATLVEYIPMLANGGDAAHPGAVLFEENCAACHGEMGEGDRFQGAPNLADSIWLYGNSPEALTASVTNARFGVMPAWGQRLAEEDVRAVAVYVHALGGGE